MLWSHISVQKAYAMNGVQCLANNIGPNTHLSFCQLTFLAAFERLAKVSNVKEGSDKVDNVIIKNAFRKFYKPSVLQGPNQPLKLQLV